MSIINFITISRIILVPLQIYLVYHYKWFAAGLYVILALTDWLDGYLARKWDRVSVLGKFLDPLADKILVNSLLIIFAFRGYIDIYSLIFLISREFIVQGIRMMVLEQGVKTIGASRVAKWKTCVLMIAIFPMILRPAPLLLTAKMLYYVGVILALISLIEYIYKNRKLFKNF